MNTIAPLESSDHALASIPGPQPRRLGAVTGHGSADLAPAGLSASGSSGIDTWHPTPPVGEPRTTTRAASRPGRRSRTPGPDPGQVWDELNPRQRAYLLTIYRLDQEAEARERGAWGAGTRARPAAEWRWLTYG
jgi:hypothetical protein